MKTRQKGSVARILVGLLVIAFIAVGIIVAFSDGDTGQSEESISQQQESMSDNTRPSSKDSDNPNYEKINLNAVEDQTGNAVAKRLVGDGSFSHELLVQTTDPPSGKFYEGWLVGDSIVSTGKLEKNSEGAWYLEFTSNDDLSNYDTVVITEETESQGLDGKPERHIFEGMFQRSVSER